MKTYQRTESCGSYARVTEIKEDGSWHTWAQWPDGMTLNHTYMTIQDMGWENIKEFLANKTGFQEI